MATAANFGKTPLLDLRFLTPGEKAKLEAVLKADQNLLIRDRVRVGTLRQELEKERYFQKQLTGKSQCTCCERRLGFLFNSGTPCPSCLYRVCKQCRVVSQKPPPPFLCPVCSKKRLLDIQAADYNTIPTANFSPSPLFGSQLLMMSLEASQPEEGGGMINPYDGKARKTLLSNFSQPHLAAGSNNKQHVTSNSTSTTAQPSREMVRSESRESGKSVDSTGVQRERPNSLPARKIPLSELSDSDEDSHERHVLEVPGLSKMRHSESISSIGSLTSMYSAAGGKGDYAISGEIRFGVWYSKEGLLKIHVDQARNLAAARKEGYSYPYVKVYLLPDRTKQTKRKTGFIRRTVSPKYDETFKYKMSESELSSRTVWLSVWDWDRFGRNQFLGELKLPLSSLDLTDTTDHWHTLLDQDESAQLESEGQYRGRLQLGLMFQLDGDDPALHPSSHGRHRKPKRKKGVLHVAIRQAEDLPRMDAGGLTNAVVKCYLLPSRTSSNKRKTQVVMNSVAPVWNEEFIYKCYEKEMVGERVLEITIWDYDKRGSNDFIGGLHIGPTPSGTSHNKEWMDSMGEEAAHWETVLSRPGEWVERWHTLRPRIDRTITVLPEKPTTPTFARELSPVREKLSPTPEEVDEEESEAEKSALLLSQQPRASSVSSVTKGNHDDTTTARAMSFPSKDTAKPSKTSGHRMSPLTQSKRIHEDLTGKSDRTPTQSHSPSPVPELLVTSDPAGISHSTSSGSIHSATSEGGQGDYEISGEVQVGFLHKRGKLLIHVNRARGLAAADSNGFSDPYVKTYLLPDRSKHSKRKTGVQRKTLNPVFDETLEYSVSQSELSSRTVWLSVWDWDRFGRNQFLGELRLPLSSLDLRSDTEMWFTLLDKDQPYNPNPNSSQMKLSLRFAPKKTDGRLTHGTLSIQVKRVSNLFVGDGTRCPDPYVKCALLPDTAEVRKTAVVKNSSSVSWKETLQFEKVTLEELVRERVLEVTVWDFDGGADVLIGGLRIGPIQSGTSWNREWMDSVQEERTHWEGMLARPGEWADQWHTLRSTMAPYKIDISAIQSGGVALDDEFRKVTAKPAASSPRDSPLSNILSHVHAHLPHHHSSGSLDEREKPSSSSRNTTPSPTQVPSKKPVENWFTRLGSSSSIPRSTPPLGSSSSIPRSTPPPAIVQAHSSNMTPDLPVVEIPKDPPRSKSGSPEAASSPDVTPHNTLERSTNHKPPPGPLKRAGLLGVKHSSSRSSFGSQLSIYSAAGGGKGDYDITGDVLVGVSYSGGKLLIHVNRARGLAAADSNGFSDPYVKTYLLPDRSKHSKRKTGVQRKTLNPVYDQTLVYTVSQSELSSQTVWLSVWDWDRFGRNQFLGEVRLPLSSLNLTDSTDQWYTLLDKDDESEPTDFYRGQLHLALRYSPSGTKKGKTRGSLEVIIKQGRDFPSMGGNETPDPVVKCYLLPDKSSSGKRKVGVIKSRNSPVWEEMVSYEKVILEDLAKERVLEVTVWDWDKKGSSFIGGLRIGPTPSGTSHIKEWMDSIGEEVTHWETMLSRPGEWVEQWHTLRTTMDHRNVAL